METTPPSAEVRKPAASSRWQRRLVLAAVGLLLVFVFRASILTGLARPLVYPEAERPADTVVIVGGDHAAERAARSVLQNEAARILVATNPPTEWEAKGILPDEYSPMRAGLESLGVSAGVVEEIRLHNVDDTLTDALARWLDRHPAARCLVLCEEMRSREVRWRLDRTLSPADRERVCLGLVVDRKFCPSNWWKSEEGISAFVTGWLSLILQMTRGDATDEWRECKPTDFTMAR